ncbi:MAG: hypothetical protein PHF14_06130 [Verrucomicrobiota bacterium]|nr:hypothetical protein [Verrucomicrobiota bacterium]
MNTSHRMLRLNRACRNRITTCNGARSIGIIALLVSFCLTPIGSVSAGLPDGWRYEATFPTGANINAVWAAAPNDVFVGGDGGVILRWDGTTWHTMNTPSQYDINAIHGTGPNDVWAVGGYSLHQDTAKRCLILHYDGNQWSETTPPDYMGWTYPLVAVHAVSANDVWALPHTGPTPVHWNGTDWEFFHIPLAVEGSLYTVSSVAPNHLFITGTHGQIIHKTGDTWTMEQRTETGNISTNLVMTFWAADIDHAFAGDNYGGLYRREPDGTWTDLGFGDGMFGDKSIRALWGKSGSEIFMIADRGYRFWDGLMETPVEISLNPTMRGSWINAHGSGNLIFCIGANGLIHEINVESNQSGVASALATGGGNVLGSPSVPLRINGTCPYGDSWFLVYGSNLWRPEESPLYIFDGHIFRPFPFPVRPENMSDEPEITAMIVNSTSDILMAWRNFFTYGQGLHRWTGEQWVEITTQYGGGLGAVERMWQADNGDLFAITTYQIYRLPSGSNTAEPLYALPDELLSTVYFTSIWGRSPTEIYIGTGVGTIYRFDGTTVHLENTPDTELAIGFICGRDNDIYALGDEHLAWKRGTSGWTVMPGVDGAGEDPFNGVIATADAVYATQATNSSFIGGGTGLIWKFVGNQATIVAQGLSGAPGHIVQTNDGSFYAVNNSGYCVTNRPLPDGFSMQRVDFNTPEWQPIGDSGVAVMPHAEIESRPLLTAWQSQLDLSAFPFGLPEDETWTIGTQQWVLQQDRQWDGTSSLPAVHVQFHYTAAELPEGAAPAQATLLRNQGGDWLEVPAATNTQTATIASLEPTDFSSWILGVQQGSPEPPTLQIESAGTNQVRLSWPTTATGFQLESAQSLAGSEWSPVPNPPTQQGDAWEVILPADGNSTFFRLGRP